MAKDIVNVVLAGATGNVGAPTLLALLAAGKFSVTVLTRAGGATAGRKDSFPAGVTVKEVDYSSVTDLTAALQGQDAVVNTMNVPMPTPHLNLIEAALAAGVYRYVPSDFGMDPENDKVMALPVFGIKKAQAGVYRPKAAASGGAFTWTVVCNGPFFNYPDFLGVDVKNKRFTRLGEGRTHRIGWTTLDSIGKAVAGVLLHPAETENRAVYVSSAVRSIEEIAALAKEATGADGWVDSTRDIDADFAKAAADVKAGNITGWAMGTFIQYGSATPEYTAKQNTGDNQLLKVPQMDDEDIKEFLKSLAS